MPAKHIHAQFIVGHMRQCVWRSDAVIVRVKLCTGGAVNHSCSLSFAQQTHAVVLLSCIEEINVITKNT